MRPWRARTLRTVAALGGLACAARAAAADPVASMRTGAPHVAYFELLGKGGLYGLGYDWAFHDRLAVGGLASFMILDDERVLTLAPYLNAYPLAGRRSALLVQVGPQFVHVGIPSHVRGFSGTSSTGLGGQLSLGYEYRSPFLFRVLATGVLGRGGFRPWVGLELGGSF